MLSTIAEHGYTLLCVVVFLEAIGFPVPAAIGLLVAGAAAATGTLQFPIALAGALLATLLGDTLMFFMGRYTGWWLLGLLCRLSLNPESCILRSADAFFRRGRMLLVFAKFVPGINTMAPPLAGSMNMRFWEFLWLDVLGAVLYTGSYLGIGFLFSGALGTITKAHEAFGYVLTWLVVLAVIGYVAFRVWTWTKARALPSVSFIDPVAAARAVAADMAVIYDVRSHGYYDRKAKRIQGSKRLEPNALHQHTLDFPDKQIVLYCTCVREATSMRVAQTLLQQGISCAVLKGGLRAWKKAGLSLESVPAEEISELPVFST